MSRMIRFDWAATFRGHARRRRSKTSERDLYRRRLSVEPLEDRRMLAVFTVDSLSDNTTDDGLVTLREAIIAANTNTLVDTIEFDPALFAGGPDTILLTLGELAITDALIIAGPGAEILTIDAQQQSRIFNINDGGVANDFDVTIAGLTLTGGRTTENFDGGGAIQSISRGHLTIDQSTITGNSTAGGSGGGIFAYGDVTLTESSVTDNHTRGSGGGVEATGNVTITDSTISGNSTAVGRGGGVSSGGNFTLTRSTLADNQSASSGGGVISGGDYFTLTDSTVSGNSTTDRRAYGGGIAAIFNEVTLLTRSTVSGNSTVGDRSYGGGILAISSGGITLIESTVSGNSTAGSDADGGGIRTFLGPLTLIQSTVTGNHATHADSTGGGIYLDFDPLTITGSIVAGNMAGGGRHDLSPGSGALTVESSLIGDGSTTRDINPIFLPIAGPFRPEGSLSVLDGMPIAGTWTLEITDDTPFDVHSGTLNSWSLLVDTTTGAAEYASSDVPVPIEAGPHLSTITITDPGTITDVNVRLNIDHPWVTDLDVFLIAPDGTRVELFTDVGFGGKISPDLVLDDDPFTITGDDGSLIGTTLSPIDPMLGPLADNGGPTETHALLLGSPAIDAGDPAPVGPTDFDQRGAPFTRVVGAAIDMGAYESQSLGLVVDTLVDELDGSILDGDVSLRDAIALAESGETITFDNALDGGVIELDIALGELTITDALTIDATALAGGLTIDAQEQSRIFNIDDGSGAFANDFDVTIAGLTLTGGMMTGDNADSLDTTFSGGAIHSLTIGHLTIVHSTIRNNITSGDHAYGGGVFAAGDVTVIQSTVSGNLSGAGGGIFAKYGAVTLVESTVSGNWSGYGGGIFSKYGVVTLVESTVSGNLSGNGGGGIFSKYGAVTVTQSTVSGNQALGTSSGICACTPDINPILFSTGTGGGIFAGGAVTISQSTVTDNLADIGGGVWNDDDTVAITGSIVAGNTAEISPDLRPGAGALDVAYSLIGDVDGLIITGIGNIVGDSAGSGVIEPLLAPLTNNGGPTKTHALLPGSPAIDAGDPAFMPPPYVDQRGFARIVDGDGIGAATVDMGAIEFGATDVPPKVIEVVRDGGADRFDVLKSLAFTFTEDVSASLDTLDLTLVNTSTGTPVDSTAASVAWDGGTNTATWDLRDVKVDAGFHRATLNAAGISDAASNALDGNANGAGGDDFRTTFLVALPGDTDLDGDIDTTDITNILSANTYDKPANWPAVWTTGDFTGDGEVTTDDIGLILSTSAFEKGPYALASQPAIVASLEPVTFSAPGVSMPLVGDGMLKHNLRESPVEVSAPEVSMAIVDDVMLQANLRAEPVEFLALGVSRAFEGGVMLKHNLRAPGPVRRSSLWRRPAEVDRVLTELDDKRREDLIRERVTDERRPLDRIWDEALLSALDGGE